MGPLQNLSIYKLLGRVNGPASLADPNLQDLPDTGQQQDNQDYPDEDPILMVSLKPEISNQTNDSFSARNTGK